MAQADTQDFDSMLRTFMVDLNGDGVPDATVQAPAGRSRSELPPPPQFVEPKYGPPRSEYVPTFGDHLQRFFEPTVGEVGQAIWDKVPSADNFTLDAAKGVAKNALMAGLEFASAAGATGGPPGAIVGNAARTLRNLPAVAGDIGERAGRLFAGGRQSYGQFGDEVSSALTAPSEAVKGFNRGNVTPREELAAAWRPMPNDMGGETAAWGKGWDAAAYPPRPPVGLPVEQQISHQPGVPGIVLRGQRQTSAEGRRPRDGTFVDQGGGYVAERADPGMASARRNALAADEVAIDARMGRWNDARTARRVEDGLAAQRPEAMADAVVNAYMPQTGFREMFARDPMRVINDLESASGVSKPNIISAMERAGFDLSFMTRDKFMARENGLMAGYYAPGGQDAFRQIQQSPVLYRQRNMPPRERNMPPRERNPGGND